MHEENNRNTFEDEIPLGSFEVAEAQPASEPVSGGVWEIDRINSTSARKLTKRGGGKPRLSPDLALATAQQRPKLSPRRGELLRAGLLREDEPQKRQMTREVQKIWQKSEWTFD
ncbi:hypothetical protein KM043_007832 [Ampulex compressa]|nr:hypothetical protein KM043_007832 [Ampulex compressa]